MNAHELAKLDNRQSVLEQKVSAIEGQLGSIVSALDRLMVKINEGQRPQWGLLLQGLGILLVLIGALFGLGVLPINQTLNRQDRDISSLQTQIMRTDAANLSVAAFKDYQDRNAADLKKFNDDLSSLRDGQVPRKEHERVWQSYDQQLESIKSQISTNSLDKQRQLDEMKQSNASIYGSRDVIQQLLSNQEKLRDEVAKLKTQP